MKPIRLPGWAKKSLFGGRKSPTEDKTTDPLFMKVGSEYYFYQNDHLGTPQKLTAINGAVVWSAKYSSFGEVTVGINTAKNNLRFPGQYYDQETGLHYNWHRYFDPKAGRYLLPDPIGFEGGLNIYIYGLNNTLKLTDPLGLDSFKGKWRRMHWQFTLPIILRKCTCYWMCIPCDNNYIWSGNIYGLPSTSGYVIHQGSGGLKRGDNCLCKPPSTETGCNKDCESEEPKEKNPEIPPEWNDNFYLA